MKFFKNLIMRCLYEKNNCFYDLSYIDDLMDFDSEEINYDFDKDFDCDKTSLLFSSKSMKNNNSKNNFFLDSHSKINDFKSCFNYFNNNINFELFHDNEGIRLFNDNDETIKILITGKKNSIKDVDISKDKKYVLITCAKYLVILSTNNSPKINNEFTLNLFQNKRKEIIILRISHNNLSKYNIINESFPKAKFIINENSNDTIIVSRLGIYSIIWNFEEVLKGDTNCYQIINVNNL